MRIAVILGFSLLCGTTVWAATAAQSGSVNITQDCGILSFDKNTQQLMFTSKYRRPQHPPIPVVLLSTDNMLALSDKIKNLFFVDSVQGDPNAVACSDPSNPLSSRLCKLDEDRASNGVKVSIEIAVGQGRSVRQSAANSAKDFFPGYIGEDYSYLLYDLDSDSTTGACKAVN